MKAILVPSSADLIKKITPKLVWEAVNAMKPCKKDSNFDVSSEMFKNSPAIFYSHFATNIRQSLIHGVLPNTVLLCTLMPLVKDNFGDITKSENYRAIAGGCLILKVLDLIVLKIEVSKLSTDALQFAYKSKQLARGQ